MTLKDITYDDIANVARIWQREDSKGTRSAIVITDDPESIAALYNPTVATILSRVPRSFGMAAVRRMLQTLFEVYPYAADIAKEILTPKDQDGNDTTGTI